MRIHSWTGCRKFATQPHQGSRVKFSVTAPAVVNGDLSNRRVVPIVFSTSIAITEPNQQTVRKLTSPTFPAHQRPVRSLFCRFDKKKATRILSFEFVATL